MAQKSTVDYSELQQLEIEALKAIYMDDFEEEETKSAAWNKKSERRFALRLRPQAEHSTSDIYASLSVTLPSTYPRTLPHLHFQFGELVSDKVANKVRTSSLARAKSLLGEEAIYEIAVLVQDILDEAVSSVAELKNLPALDQERTEHEAKKLQAAADAESAAIRDEEIIAKQQEHARLALVDRELARQEEYKQANIEKSSTFIDNSLLSPQANISVLNFDQQINVRAPITGKVITFRSVYAKEFYKLGTISNVYTVRPVTETSGDDSGPRFLAVKICNLGKDWDEESLKTAIAKNLEANLQSLQVVPEHRNILPILGYSIESHFGESQVRVWTVRVLTDFISRGSLRDVLEVTERIDADTFRTIIIQILEGLHHLHSHGVIHGRITLSNILIERQSSGALTVKLSDCLYQAELHRLRRSKNADTHSEAGGHWNPPRSTGLEGTSADVGQDLWQLGIVMSQLLFGLNVQTQYSSPSAMLRALELNASLERMLSSVFHARSTKRPSCFDLLATAFLRSDDSIYKQQMGPMSPVALHPSDRQRPSRTRNDSIHQPMGLISRYKQDFSEFTTLGSGGFGKVVRARNRLDGQWYALKTIVSESTHELQSVLGEVMLLSRLSHSHVVRYITAWLEESSMSSAITVESDSDFEGDDKQSTTYEETDLSRTGSIIFQQLSSTGGGLDYIGSDNYVQFCDDDSDDKTEASSDDTESVDSPVFDDNKRIPIPNRAAKNVSLKDSSQISSTNDRDVRTILYIQMEYCENRTLRDLIRGGLPSRPDEYWRVLRQITSALEYVHSQGVIHRDLKPENVFVTQGNVRLGDFGLAKPTAMNRQRGHSGGVIGSLTASIGTSVYIAPEVRSSGGGKYDEKADMYSLGIILFEMCCNLDVTAMERAQILEDLRKSDSVFPAELSRSERSRERDLISRLLLHDPVDRPGAAALLELLPTDTDDDMVRRQIENIAGNKEDPLHRKLVSQLFAAPGEADARSYTYDLDVSMGAHEPHKAYLYGLIRRRVVSIFQYHGAVEALPQQILVPVTEDQSDGVRLMTADGTLVQLPYDLILPRARRLAKQKFNCPSKLYSINTVYRPAGSIHPQGFDVADFDIISKSSNLASFQEAEVLKVVDEIIEAIPALSTKSIRFVVNHSNLLDAILHACKIPRGKFAAVKVHLSRLRGERATSHIRSELRGPDVGISSTSIDDLFRLDFTDTLENGLSRLERFLGESIEIKAAVSHMKLLHNYVRGLGIQHDIHFDPLSCCNAEYYKNGVMFQCVFTGKKRAILCAGGRYDRLIRDYALSRTSNACQAVGFSLSLTGVLNSMVQFQSRSQKLQSRRHEDLSDLTWTERRCDVLVDSTDVNVLSSVGVKILKELWANNIRAELNDGIDTSATSAHTEHPEHELVLMIRADGSLRLHGRVRRDDVEVRRSELVSALRQELRERDRTYHSRLSERLRPRQEMNESVAREVDVQVLWSSNRSKKSNRQLIVDEALSCTATNAHQHLDMPIIAVELKDDVFDLLRRTRLADPESWKSVVQNVEPGSRRYVSEIHELLTEKAQGPQISKGAYLYNFRTKACICYDLSGQP